VTLAVTVPTTATNKLQAIQWHLLLLCQPQPQTNCRPYSDTCCYCANHCHKQTADHTVTLTVTVPTTATNKLQAIQWHLLLLCQPQPQTNCRSYSDTYCYCANHSHKQTAGHTVTFAVIVPTTATNKLQAIQWHLLLLCQPLPETNCRSYSDTCCYCANHCHKQTAGHTVTLAVTVPTTATDKLQVIQWHFQFLQDIWSRPCSHI